MKHFKIIALFSLICAVFALSSCSSVYEQERAKTARSSAASERINNSSSNNSDLFNEID